MKKLNSKTTWIIVLLLLTIGFGFASYSEKKEREFLRCLNQYEGPSGLQEICGRKILIEENPYD